MRLFFLRVRVGRRLPDKRPGPQIFPINRLHDEWPALPRTANPTKTVRDGLLVRKALEQRNSRAAYAAVDDKMSATEAPATRQ